MSVLSCPRFAIVLAIAITLSITMHGQTVQNTESRPGKLIGTVTDVNGDPVANATVTLETPESDNRRTLATPENGFFEFDDVKPGSSYQVSITARDFADWASPVLTIEPGQFKIVTGIELEEHFDFPAGAIYAAPGSPEFHRQIQDLGSGRIAEMDRGAVQVCSSSLVGPGIQAITNPRQAAEVAREATTILAESIAKNPKRPRGFAALALQDPLGAAQELTRCVKDLGFCGALVNGFTQSGQEDSPAREADISRAISTGHLMC
jgi:hypothetical protein